MSQNKELKRLINSLLRKSPRELAKASDFSDYNCSQIVRNVDIVLPVAMVLHAFSEAPEQFITPKVKLWLGKLKRFIKKQDKNYSYSYWIRGSRSSKKFPLPDDLDDTSFCISSLISAGEKIDEKTFLKIMSIESKEGGPYWTWYVPKLKKYMSWQDVDPSVNANFIHATSLYGIRLKNTEKYLLRSLKNGKLLSKYYPSELITLFYLSRFYHQTKDEKFHDEISKHLKKYKQKKFSKIEKLLYLLTKSYLGTKLRSTEISKFKIEPLPFCHGFFHGNNEKTFVGSEVITSTLLLELQFIQMKLQHVAQKDKKSELPRPVKNIIKTAEKGMGKNYKFHNVLMVPYYSALALKKTVSEADLQKIKHLSLGLFYSWRGYTVLDEIVDGQINLEQHSQANSLVKKGNQNFAKIKNKEFHEGLRKAFSQSDLSYIDEVLQKGRETYDYVEKRMMPFLITMKHLPLLLGLDKSKGKSLYKIFKAQMVIDQLNDEAHDWKEDYKFKRITYVTSKLEGKKSPNFNKIFWTRIMPLVISDCTKEYKIALREIKRLKPRNDFLTSIIEKSYTPIRKAEEEMKNIQKLLHSL